jgi:hypothetical protein
MASRSKPSLPPFNDYGLLPVGTYQLTLAQLRESALVTGTDYGPEWDSEWRRRLVDNLEILARQLWAVGIQSIYVDGSFVEDKPRPNDIDGYFPVDLAYFISRRLARDLNALDPHTVWTWDPKERKEDPDSGKAQLPMWFHYHVELYPDIGLPTNILDEHGNQQKFPAAFRKSRRDHQPKGIIRLVRD